MRCHPSDPRGRLSPGRGPKGAEAKVPLALLTGPSERGLRAGGTAGPCFTPSVSVRGSSADSQSLTMEGKVARCPRCLPRHPLSFHLLSKDEGSPFPTARWAVGGPWSVTSYHLGTCKGRRLTLPPRPPESEAL